MKVNEKLQHLSEQQINELLELYQDKTVKISYIIDKYKIDVKPAGLKKILPPANSDIDCIICGEKMSYKLTSRDSIQTEKDYFCLNCGHKQYRDYWGRIERCNCIGCTNLRLQEEKEKRELIEAAYTDEWDKIPFEDMALNDQVILIYLLLNNPLHNTIRIEPFHGEIKLIPILNRLLDIHAISVSPDSNTKAFYTENFPNRFDVTLVNYNVNVLFNDEEIKQINKHKYFIDNSDQDELISLYKCYMHRDLIEKFSGMMEDRRLSLNISKDADDRFRQLIDIISYSKILGLCLRVAKFMSDKVLVGDMPSYVANNAALGNVAKFYEKALEFGWNLNEADYEQAGDNLTFFIETIMGKDISILQDVASIENLMEWPDREKDYSN